MSGQPRVFICMGVSGSGKSTVGELLAKEIGCLCLDADDFHPKSNKEKMSNGIPLNDDDRKPCLDALAAQVSSFNTQCKYVVMCCSALKRRYRDILRGTNSPQDVVFLYLKGSLELLSARLQTRAATTNHFMPPTLLKSQFEALEEPTEQEAVHLDIATTPEDCVREIIQRFHLLVNAH